MSIDTAPDADKSAEKSAQLYGAAADPALRGRGPAPGAANAGRPPVAFAQECKDLQRDVVLPKVRKVLEDANKGPKDADWQWCTRFISKYGEKETARRMELGGLDGGPLMIEHVLRENAKARQDGET